jgi:hypothetical protein
LEEGVSPQPGVSDQWRLTEATSGLCNNTALGPTNGKRLRLRLQVKLLAMSGFANASELTRHVTSHHKDSPGTGSLIAVNNSMHWLPRASLTPHLHAVGPNCSACEVDCWQGTHNKSTL